MSMPPSGAGRPGIILDRDGTLIDVVRDEESGVISTAFHPAQIRILPGVLDGLHALANAGYGFAIATNQPGPAKGQFSRAAVERTNEALVSTLRAAGIAISVVETCLHHPTGGAGGDEQLRVECECRKPKPGLLQRAMRRAAFDPQRTWMVGDSPADVLAARAAGVRAALLFDGNRCELCPLRGGPAIAPDVHAARFDDLARAVLAAS